MLRCFHELAGLGNILLNRYFNWQSVQQQEGWSERGAEVAGRQKRCILCNSQVLDMETICLVVKIFWGCVYIVHAFLERGSFVMNVKYNMLVSMYKLKYLHFIAPKMICCYLF